MASSATTSDFDSDDEQLRAGFYDDTCCGYTHRDDRRKELFQARVSALTARQKKLATAASIVLLKKIKSIIMSLNEYGLPGEDQWREHVEENYSDVWEKVIFDDDKDGIFEKELSKLMKVPKNMTRIRKTLQDHLYKLIKVVLIRSDGEESNLQW